MAKYVYYSGNSLAAKVPVPIQALSRNALVRLRHRGLGAPDLILASYPKSGSTWLRFVLANALCGEDMDWDRIEVASPPIGRHSGAESILPDGGRFIKSHEAPRFVGFGPRPRVLCLVRDGRDVAVSYYHHMRRRGYELGTVDAFAQQLVRGRVGAYGSWQGHVRHWLDYAAGRATATAVIRYEDMLDNPLEHLMSINDQFALGVDASRFEAALAVSTPEGMRSKEAGSNRLAQLSGNRSTFVRSATSGGWAEALSEQTARDFERLAGRELADLGYE